MQTNHSTSCSKWIILHALVLSLMIFVPTSCPSQTLNESPDQVWTVGYSEEQYASFFYEGYRDFAEAVAKRIDPIDCGPMEKVVKVMESITHLLRERVPLVLAGYQQCHNGGCREGSVLWKIHNTLDRDEMINLLMGQLSRIIELNHLDPEMVEGMMKAISIDILKTRSLTFYDVYQNCSWLSPHPKDSIDARWGLKKCEMMQAQIRTARDNIAFIETIYGEKDPKYAACSMAATGNPPKSQRAVDEFPMPFCYPSGIGVAEPQSMLRIGYKKEMDKNVAAKIQM